MVTLGMVVIGGLLWWTDNYTAAFWLIIFAIVSGLGAVVRAVANPDWYAAGRAQAGLGTDLFNPSKGIRSLIITKAVITIVLAFFAWKVGQQAGYFRPSVPKISADGEIWVRQIGEASKACINKYKAKFGDPKNDRFADCMSEQTRNVTESCVGRSDFSTCVTGRSLRVMQTCDLSRC